MRHLLASLAVQCTAINGALGTFLYDPAGDAKPGTGPLLSPVFADSADLYRFAQARGWTSARDVGPFAFTRVDEPVEVSVADLQPGDLLDLEGDPFADKTEDGAPNPFEFEMAAVESVEPETDDCILITSQLINCGFPPEHKIKVCGFEGGMVDGVTGKPATLMIHGVALAH